MADLTITATSVVKGAGAITETGTAGAALTAGQPIYQDTSDLSWKLADADTLAASLAEGITLHAAGTGQPITFQRSGPITIGATLTAGETYVVSTTAGGICPISDLASGDYTTILGIATTTSVLRVQIVQGQTAKA